ncbi:hypothetical protein [Blastopirellula marina]|uniref:Uncharacterized protein n=1 Tax=Blastopirellula marina TaxID=124 RepID=A0A2S8FHN0_9BACT|nr:hypothetical protein [Blastopirellula marina]PQO31691.1 hypothetical protein C5Y98_19960 [Blastopirellula marina]PTL42998.1 hypothetical protein C5Y97_19970 [Blastopirellula marina]
MARKSVTWVAWGWLTLLGLMLLIPLMGIIVDQATALSSLVFPIFTGAMLGAATLVAVVHLRKHPWSWSFVLALWALFLILFHRQLGLLLVGSLLGVGLIIFRTAVLGGIKRAFAWGKQRFKRDAKQAK